MGWHYWLGYHSLQRVRNLRSILAVPFSWSLTMPPGQNRCLAVRLCFLSLSILLSLAYMCFLNCSREMSSTSRIAGWEMFNTSRTAGWEMSSISCTTGREVLVSHGQLCSTSSPETHLACVSTGRRYPPA